MSETPLVSSVPQRRFAFLAAVPAIVLVGLLAMPPVAAYAGNQGFGTDIFQLPTGFTNNAGQPANDLRRLGLSSDASNLYFYFRVNTPGTPAASDFFATYPNLYGVDFDTDATTGAFYSAQWSWSTASGTWTRSFIYTGGVGGSQGSNALPNPVWVCNELKATVPLAMLKIPPTSVKVADAVTASDNTLNGKTFDLTSAPAVTYSLSTTQASDQVTGLSAVYSASPDKISLTWTPPVGGPAPVSYNILRGSTSGSETFLVNSGSATASYADTAVAPGATYFYKVEAVFCAAPLEKGTQSAEASASVPSNVVPPALKVPSVTSTPLTINIYGSPSSFVASLTGSVNNYLSGPESCSWTSVPSGPMITAATCTPTAATASLTSAATGDYVVTLTVQDSRNVPDSKSVSVHVVDPNGVAITPSGLPDNPLIDTTVSFPISVTGGSPPSSVTCDWSLRDGANGLVDSAKATTQGTPGISGAQVVFHQAGAYHVVVACSDTAAVTHSDTYIFTIQAVAPPPPPPPTSSDFDQDGIADALDNCPSVPNVNQADTDADGTGDACDSAPETAAPGPTSTSSGTSTSGPATTSGPDADKDGVTDSADNCKTIPNSSQADLDADGFGDACDLDLDGDAVGNANDNCPLVANPKQGDANRNGIGDACEGTAGQGLGGQACHIQCTTGSPVTSSQVGESTVASGLLGFGAAVVITGLGAVAIGVFLLRKKN